MYDPRDPWPFAGTFAASRPRKALRAAVPTLGQEQQERTKQRYRPGRPEVEPGMVGTIGEVLIGKTDRRAFGRLLDQLLKK
jgi:hypothetical protein